MSKTKVAYIHIVFKDGNIATTTTRSDLAASVHASRLFVGGKALIEKIVVTRIDGESYTIS